MGRVEKNSLQEFNTHRCCTMSRIVSR